MPKYTTPLSLETSGIKITDPTDPAYLLVTESGEDAVKQRIYHSPDGLVWTFNASWDEDSSSWNRDSIGNMAELLTYRPNFDVPFRIQRVLGGANPITWNSAETLTPTKAWASVYVVGGPAVGSSEVSNISSITFPIATTMRLTFSTPMADTNYVVHGSASHAAALYVDTRNTGYVDVRYMDIATGTDVTFGAFLRHYMVSIVSHPYRAL
jgi:hypothetical protein